MDNILNNSAADAVGSIGNSRLAVHNECDFCETNKVLE
jgi:hypothetical protein